MRKNIKPTKQSHFSSCPSIPLPSLPLFIYRLCASACEAQGNGPPAIVLNSSLLHWQLFHSLLAPLVATAFCQFFTSPFIRLSPKQLPTNLWLLKSTLSTLFAFYTTSNLCFQGKGPLILLWCFCLVFSSVFLKNLHDMFMLSSKTLFRKW